MARKAAAQVKADTPELEPTPVLTEDIEIDLSEPETKESGNGIAAPEPIQIETAPAAPEPAPPAAEDTAALRKRLQEMEAAEGMAREAERAAREQLAQIQRQQNQGQWQAQKQIFDAQYDAIVNSMGAAQSELASAKNDLRSAGGEGNWEQIGEIQERIGRASADLRELERRKEWMDNQLEQWKRAQQQPRQPQQQQPPTVESIIANSGLPDRAKTWLRAHPDYISDPSKNQELQGLHRVAARQAGGEFTDAYFDRMEVLLGFKQESQSSPAAPQSQPQTQRQSVQVSAPPTRETPSMSTGRAPQPTKVTLNAEEREVAATIAASRNISQAEAEREYAKQKLRMMQEKREGRHA